MVDRRSARALEAGAGNQARDPDGQSGPLVG
jgi:hypothetical protein